MPRNLEHDMLATPTPGDEARQRFILAMKNHLGGQLRPQLRKVYDAQAKPGYTVRAGHEPDDTASIAEALYDNNIYQAWSSLYRAAQERMWSSVKAPLDRERSALEQNYAGYAKAPKGSLELSDEVEAPEAIKKVDIHLQPGGYTLDEGPRDIMAGALYEAGGRLYSQGVGVGTIESKAECVMRFVKEWAPDFHPTRILDMACSAGSSSVPYALAFPDAEVHGIDIGAGLLRYAHARAEALGAKVHFHQASVEKTGFEDQSFDLVVSHNAMHEMSVETQQRMMTEAYRLLKPGGICIHQDVPLRFEKLDPVMQVIHGWDQNFNGEPFWSAYGTNDCQAMLKHAGFSEENIFVGPFEQIDQSFSWFLAAGRKE